MRLSELWKQNGSPTLSFEFFPAKTEKAEERLRKTIDSLASLEPDFVSVTFGAGGSTREGSHQLVQMLKEEKGLEVLPYFACYGLSPEAIIEVLDAYYMLGIENILAVRGDEPHEEGFEPHPKSLAHASDLVSFIRPRYEFCIGVAGYPEGHIQAESKDKDLEYLKLKVDLGAEFIITNYCYDNQYFFDFVERARAIGIKVPILPGVMPIYSIKMMEMLANLCGASITDAIREGIAALDEDDKDGLLAFGVEYALDLCRELLANGVPGLHFYTMDRSHSTERIVETLRIENLL